MITNRALLAFYSGLSDAALFQEGVDALTDHRRIIRTEYVKVRLATIREFIIEHRGLVSMWRDVEIEVGKNYP